MATVPTPSTIRRHSGRRSTSEAATCGTMPSDTAEHGDVEVLAGQQLERLLAGPVVPVALRIVLPRRLAARRRVAEAREAADAG